MATKASTSARLPTGNSVEASPEDSSPAYPATVTWTRNHPADRHSHGEVMRNACTRPGGTVCARVSSRPRRRRSPSGDSATRKSYAPANDANSAGTMEIAAGPRIRSGCQRRSSRAAAMLPMTTRTENTVSEDLRMLPTSRPAGTVSSSCSGATGASAAPISSPAALASSSARSRWAAGSSR